MCVDYSTLKYTYRVIVCRWYLFRRVSSFQVPVQAQRGDTLSTYIHVDIRGYIHIYPRYTWIYVSTYIVDTYTEDQYCVHSELA